MGVLNVLAIIWKRKEKKRKHRLSDEEYNERNGRIILFSLHQWRAHICTITSCHQYKEISYIENIKNRNKLDLGINYMAIE